MKKLNVFILSALALIPSGALAQTPAFDLLEEGRAAYLDYDFDEAARLYAAAQKKAKKGDAEFTEQHELYKDQLDRARNFLNRVERLEILDSIAVPKETFFKAYRLPQSSGSLGTASALPKGASREGVDYVFTSEMGDYKIWASPDSVGDLKLMEATRLTDGSWSKPAHVDDELASDGDAAFPFMMPDGVTLYYAENGENSIGGYDIMVATRDAADGEFLQPQNMGMPYNSPYDDYLLAIDELTGVGWWATDRNCLGDMLTVYLFKVNDLRSNYDPDMEDLVDYARISDISLTRDPDSDYASLLSEVRAIDPDAVSRKPDFFFPMDGGVVYHFYDDFRSASARKLMRQYVEGQAALESMKNDLTSSRQKYASRRSSSLASQIKDMEQRLEQESKKVARLRSDVYRAERSGK